MSDDFNISKISVYLFFVFSNIGWLMTFPTSYLIEHFTKGAWLVPLILLIPLVIVAFIFPKNSTNLLKKIQSSSIVNVVLKVLLVLYCFGQILIFTHFFSNIISFLYYPLNTNIIFGVVLIISVLFVSTIGIKQLFHLGSFIGGIVLLLWLVITIIVPSRDVSLLLPLSFNFDEPYMMLLLLLPLFDLILIKFIEPSVNGIINGKHFFMMSAISLIGIFLLLFNCYTIVNYQFYEGLYMPSLYAFRTFPYNRYIEHFDLIVMIIIVPTFLFKGSFYLQITRLTIGINHNWLYYIIAFVALTGSFIFTDYFNALPTTTWQWLIISCLVCLLLIFAIIVAKMSTKRKKSYETS